MKQIFLFSEEVPADTQQHSGAADLGQTVTIIEREKTIGGVCLNVGCIPSKTLLHAASVIEDTESVSKYGIVFSKPEIDIKTLNQHKEKIINNLVSGLNKLCELRKIKVIYGTAK